MTFLGKIVLQSAHKLKIKRYVRYVDDFVIISENKENLKQWHIEIKEFLKNRLLLQLKDGSKITALSNGINFLGYYQHTGHRLVRRRVTGNFKKKLNEWKEKEKSRRLNFEEIQKLNSVVNSYLAHGGHADFCKKEAEIVRNNKWLKDYLVLKKWKSEIKKDIKEEHWAKMNNELRGYNHETY
ncbi:MAG: hypothetical protein ACOX2F_04585 [bacterium]